MADQKRWFKVWTTICLDPAFRAASLEDIGRWALLGAAAVAVGTAGSIDFDAAGHGLSELLRTADLDQSKSVLQRLPGVQFEEGKNRYGGISVTFKNWHKYQIDHTAAERMKSLRSKRRGEEIRREERRQEPRTTLSGERPTALRLLEFLNKKTGRHYQPVESNLRLIVARLKAGATEEQCRAVVGRKCAQWLGDAKMAEYLRPATLFNATNFAQYQGELPATAFTPEHNGDAH